MACGINKYNGGREEEREYSILGRGVEGGAVGVNVEGGMLERGDGQINRGRNR